MLYASHGFPWVKGQFGISRGLMFFLEVLMTGRPSQ